MSPIAKLVIQDLYVLLKENLPPILIVDHLFQLNLCSYEQLRRVKCRPNEDEQNQELLDMLISKDDSALEVVLDVLSKEGGQQFLISAITASLEHYRKAAVRTSVQASATVKLGSGIWFDVPESTKLFTGRTQLLDQLRSSVEESLQSDLHGATGSNFVLYGIGGIGKTEIAIKFARDYGGLLFQGNVIWINADTLETYTEAIQRLARQYKHVFGEQLEGQEENTAMHVIIRHFGLSHTPCLIILDNAANAENTNFDIETLHNKLTLPPSSRMPVILMCSRDNNWPSLNLTLLPVPVYTHQEALEFMSLALPDCVENVFSSGVIDQIISELGYLPLAVQQAAASIRENVRRHLLLKNTEYGPADYLRTLLEKRETLDLLNDRNFIRQMNCRYDRTTYLTWKVTLDEIRASQYGSLAFTFLKQIAYCDPDNVHADWFLKMSGMSEVQSSTGDRFHETSSKKGDPAQYCDEAFLLLERYSILKLDRGVFSIHRLVQEVVRLELELDEEVENLLIETWSLFARVVREDKDWKCLPHVVSIWNHGNRFENFVLSASPTIPRVLVLFRESGKYLEGCRFGEKTLARIGSTIQAPEFAVLMSGVKLEFACLLHAHGKELEAANIYEELVITDAYALGEAHEIICAAKHNIAALFEAKGDYEEAIPLYQRVISLREITLGEEHETTLETKTNLANCMDMAGKPMLALRLYRQIRRAQTEKFGDTHPSSLMTQHNIALILQSIGKLDLAQKLLEFVVQERESKLGSLHHHTMQSRGNLALIYKNKAAEIHQNIIKAFEKSPAQNFRSLLTTKYNLAEVCVLMENTQMAKELYSQVLSSEVRIMDGQTPATIIDAKSNLANLLHQEEKFEEALMLFKDVCETRHRQNGAEHAQTLSARENIAVCICSMGEHDEAIKMYTRLLEIRARKPDQDKSAALKTELRLADALRAKQDIPKALMHYKIVVEALEASVGASHVDTLRAQKNLALALCEGDEYLEAAKLQRVALTGLQAALGPTHNETLGTIEELAYTLICDGSSEGKSEAAELYTKLCEEREKLLGRFHPDYARVFLTLGTLTRTGEPDLEIHLHEQLLSDRHLYTPSQDQHVWGGLTRLAKLYEEKRNYSRALELQFQVLTFWRTTLCFSDARILDTHFKILALLKKIRDWGGVAAKYRELIELETRILGPDVASPNLALNKCELAAALENSGLYKEAMLEYESVPNIKDCEGSLLTLVEEARARELVRTGKYEAALAIWLSLLGPAIPEDTLNLKCSIAKVLATMERREEGSRYLQDVLEIVGGNEDDKAALRWSALTVKAKLLEQDGRLEEGREMLLAVQQEQVAELGSEHPDTLETEMEVTKKVIAGVKISGESDHCEAINEALIELTRIYDSQCKLRGTVHPESLRTRHQIAKFTGVLKNGNGGKAQELFKSVLGLQLVQLGPDHVDTLLTQLDFGEYLHQVGNLKTAHSYAAMACHGFKSAFGDSHSMTKRAKCLLGMIEAK